MKVTDIEIQNRPKFISVGKTPQWFFVSYTLNGSSQRFDFADTGQTKAQIDQAIKDHAGRIAQTMAEGLEI